MAGFSEPFDSLAAWSYGTSPSTELTLAAATPAPYLGPSRGTQTQDILWAAAQYDLVDGGVPATMYWVSFAFYVPSWAPINTAVISPLLPGFINDNVDPMDAIQFNGTAGAFQPYLTATSSSTGTISSYYGTGDAVTAGVWHTVRYGLRLQRGHIPRDDVSRQRAGGGLRPESLRPVGDDRVDGDHRRRLRPGCR